MHLVYNFTTRCMKKQGIFVWRSISVQRAEIVLTCECTARWDDFLSIIDIEKEQKSRDIDIIEKWNRIIDDMHIYVYSNTFI